MRVPRGAHTPLLCSVAKEYTGFTEDEVKELCVRFDMDFAETSGWYDGYMLREFKHIYNPRPVVAAMQKRHFANYRTSTETYATVEC